MLDEFWTKIFCYPSTMYESIFAQMYLFLVEKYYLQFLLIFFIGADLTSSVRHNYCMDSNIPLIHCSQSTIVHIFKLPKILPAYRNDANGLKPESNSKMSDKHAAEF